MEHLVTMETPSQAAPRHPGQPSCVRVSGARSLLHREPSFPTFQPRGFCHLPAQNQPTQPPRGCWPHQPRSPVHPAPHSVLLWPLKGHLSPLRAPAPTRAPTHRPWRPSAAWPSSQGHADHPLLGQGPSHRAGPSGSPCSLLSRKPRALRRRSHSRQEEPGLRIKEFKGPQDLQPLVHPSAPASGAAAGAGRDGVKHGAEQHVLPGIVSTRNARKTHRRQLVPGPDRGSPWTLRAGPELSQEDVLEALSCLLSLLLASPWPQGPPGQHSHRPRLPASFPETRGRSPGPAAGTGTAACQRPRQPTGTPPRAARAA